MGSRTQDAAVYIHVPSIKMFCERGTGTSPVDASSLIGAHTQVAAVCVCLPPR